MGSCKCFSCEKKVGEEFLKKKVRCPFCGAKMVFKPRTQLTKVKAR
jgi:DNA-directed RNA polymerase subunit RPC12/RpoP